MQAYEYGAISELYINEMLRYTWARMPCFRQTDSFAPWFQHPLSQDGRTLIPDDTQLQIFNEVRGELQDILGKTKLL